MDASQPDALDQRAAEDPLQQPLLRAVSGSSPEQRVIGVIRLVDTEQQEYEDQQRQAHGTGVPGSTVMLAKTIVGAGAAALPFAFARLGLGTSVAFLLLVGFMTHFSIQALAQGAVTTGHFSYPQIVDALVGRPAAVLLECSLVLRCAGLICVYLVLGIDILAGSPALPGLLCDLVGSAGGQWCSERQPVALALTLLVLAPLVTPRRLSAARITSMVGLSAVGVWVVVTLGVSVTAQVHGKAHHMRWLPDPTVLDGASLTQKVVNLLATLPVIATAYTCQMTVMPIASELAPFSQSRMSLVSAGAVGLCTIIFVSVGLGSYAAFGKHVPADVLEAFNESALHALVGSTVARALGLLVRVGFLLSVLANVPLQMFPYRENLFRLLFGRELHGAAYYALTYASLAVFYFTAVAASSIWVPLQLVGATAGAIIAFFVPAAVALRAEATRSLDTAGAMSAGYWKVNAWGLIVLGVIQAVTGVTAVLLNGTKH